MEIDYHNSGSILRAGVESLEDRDSERPYTKDLEVYIENVFRPIVYDRLDQMSHHLPEEFGDVPEEIETAIQDSRNIDDEFEEEFSYWEERFGKMDDSTLPPEQYLESLDKNLREFEDFQSIIYPAVEGICLGIMAKDLLDIENHVIVGYDGSKTLEDSRSTAFKTGNVEGDVLMVDDIVSSGSTIAGTAEALDNGSSRFMTVEAEGQENEQDLNSEEVKTYEFTNNPYLWKFRDLLGLNQEPKPDRLIKKKLGKVEIEPIEK